MGLPGEFHEQCRRSLEQDYLKTFYRWTQEAASSVTNRIIESDSAVPEVKVCTAALDHMLQILNWDFRSNTSETKINVNVFSAGVRQDGDSLKRSECHLVQPGSDWHDVLILSSHVGWLLSLYAALRLKFSCEGYWLDCPIAVSARKLVVQFCSLTGAVFLSDDGKMHEQHLLQLLSGIIEWVDPPDAVSKAIENGKSDSEMLDGCRALLAIANVTTPYVFEGLLKSMRPIGTLTFLSMLMSEVIKVLMTSNTEEETWSWEARDVLLDTWTAILTPINTINVNALLPSEGIKAAANLFGFIVECELRLASATAFNDEGDSDYLHASVSAMDERLSCYALIARASIDVTIPLLIRVFSERVGHLNQGRGIIDLTETLEELYSLLLIIGHVIADEGEGELPLVPNTIQTQFVVNAVEADKHPVILLSSSIIKFAEQCLSPEMRASVFSPRLMESIIWFLARWSRTYLMSSDGIGEKILDSGHHHEHSSKKALLCFFGEHNQGKLVLDIIVRISFIALTSYPGEKDLQEWKKDVVDVRRVGDRIIALKLVVGQDTFNVISGYAPQVGLAEHFKVKFWEDLEGVLQDIPQGEKVFLGGDLNGHVGSVARGFERVHGGFGLGEMNGEGKSILEFSEALDLSIANTWFKKREEHLITYKSGGTCSQIDFFLIRKSDRKYCLNCKVILGESLTTQHRVLVMDVRIRDRAKRRSPMVAPRIKWWHLKGEKQGIFQQKIWEGWCGQSQGSANDMWNKMSQEIIKDDGEIERDVNHRIQAGWMKWTKASGVLCDAKVPIKLKGKFYRTAVRPAILYGTECWAVKSQHENKVGVAEMRMLRWMCGKTRQDKIRNEAIRVRVGVAPIVEKMVENRLRWFGHVERRPVDSVVRRVDQMERRQTIRGRGRPKKTIREVIKKDLELNDLDRSMGLTCYQLLHSLVQQKHICVHLVTLNSWRELATVFSTEKTLLLLDTAHQRSLAQTLVRSASGIRNSEASSQYVRNLMGPIATYIVEISSKSNFKSIAQQPDILLSVSCMLERLRGAASASEPRTQKAIYDLGFSVMNHILVFLEVYKHESAVVYLLLKFVVDWIDGQITYLEAQETAAVVNFCMRLLQLYSSHNIGKISLSLSSSLLSEAKTDKYRDLRALLQLLSSLCSKDMIDFSSDSIEAQGTNISQVVYFGLHMVTPLISMDLLKYPKLCHDYFSLLSHMLEVYPETFAQLNSEAFAHILGTLDFGLHHQDADVVSKCLRALQALASYHYKETGSGNIGLGAHTVGHKDSSGNVQEGLLNRFLRSLLQLLLFEDYSSDLISVAADALLPLILCEQGLYQRLGNELIERQPNATLKSRLANALHTLTSANQLSSSLDRINYQRFRKNLNSFLVQVRGFLRTM
ncbi:Exportin-4 [Glycine soja]